MTHSRTETPAEGPARPLELRNGAGLWFELLTHGGLRRAGLGETILGHFVGHEAEPPFANLWLRCSTDQGVRLLPLLGPGNDGAWEVAAHGRSASFSARADHPLRGLRWSVHLRLAADTPAWIWNVQVCHDEAEAIALEVVHLQDIGLTSYGALRLNEHYVSQYVDLQPLEHAECGAVLAARQNQPLDGRHPWALMGSMTGCVAWATDGLQVQGLAPRGGGQPEGLVSGLPSSRLQHEHACVALQAPSQIVAAGAIAQFGFFGFMVKDHPAASGMADLVAVEPVLAFSRETQAQLQPALWSPPAGPVTLSGSLFTSAPWLDVLDLDEALSTQLFGPARAHEERDAQGSLLSWFAGPGRHVVTRAKELQVLRPHGHLLRGGDALVPDESALTSTVWMGGVFHSMLTQGHVSINRLLSTAHGYLAQFRSHGLRLFVDAGQGWQQLGTPSAFEIKTDACSWVYRHAQGLLRVTSAAKTDALTLGVEVLEGLPVKVRASLHVALAGDDGAALVPVSWKVMSRRDGSVAECQLLPPPGSGLAERFPNGSFIVQPGAGSTLTEVHGDAALFADGRTRGEPFVCLDAQAAPEFELQILGRLISEVDASAVDAALPDIELQPPAGAPGASLMAGLSSILPWFRHNALIHYLAPRGLEQYSGGGWGTRDVCQGPLEMLLAARRTEPARDLLLRTFAAQNPDGDWPQWFMFFERDRAIRAGDSHGDIVFWPLLGLGRYLLASRDSALLDECVPFFGEAAPSPLWAHVERALALIKARQIPGTHLAAYGHGDWNDSLQPADPSLRERMCSAWTVTLHHQTLLSLAQAWEGIARPDLADTLRLEAEQVRRDFQRLLVADGVVAGYALFNDGPDHPELLLHPRDTRTGLHYSLLPMMHAVLEDMLPPTQAHDQIDQIRRHLVAPDGARLFDAPLAYQGGPQQLFQRAESSSYFGREIGVMYVHAHLRWAQTLAHMGDGAGFVDALARVNPIGLGDLVPNAGLRQSNTYFSSSDAAFADRYEAVLRYGDVLAGRVRVEGGWRVYSSGPGIFLHLVRRHVVGIIEEADEVIFDPVLPVALDGLRVRATVLGVEVEILHHTGNVGFGPAVISVDGQALPFSRQPHPYRVGPARVSRTALASLLAMPSQHQIVVQLG